MSESLSAAGSASAGHSRLTCPPEGEPAIASPGWRLDDLAGNINETRGSRQAGFTLLTALFLLVVVSALAGFMVNLATSQHLSSAIEVNNLRARYALVSGFQWASYQIEQTGSCPGGVSLVVEGFTVTQLGCTPYAVTEGALGYQLFDVTMQAERGSFGQVDYARVRMRAMLSRS